MLRPNRRDETYPQNPRQIAKQPTCEHDIADHRGRSHFLVGRHNRSGVASPKPEETNLSLHQLCHFAIDTAERMLFAQF